MEEIRKKILVVDDDKNICRSLSFCFSEEGYLTDTAYTGNDALKEVGLFHPDLIILDYMLPDMSGVDVCRTLKRNEATKPIPVIMLTARSNRTDKIKGLDCGAEDYITKPYDGFELLARVRSHLRVKTLYDYVKADERDYAAILDMTSKLTSSLNARDTLGYIVAKMAEITNVKRCSIVYIGNNKEVGYVIASHDDTDVRNLKIDITKYPEIKKVLLDGKELIIYDAHNEPLMSQVKNILKEKDIKGIILFPIIFEDEIIGTLILRSINVDKIFTERELRLCQLIANVSAGPLKIAFLYETALNTSNREKIARLEAEKSLKDAKETLKTILNNIDIGVSFISIDHKVQFINPYFANIYNNAPSHFTNKECYRVFENRDAVCENCPGNLAMRLGSKVNIERKFAGKDGKERYMDITAYPVFDSKKKVAGFIYQKEDITERKIHQEEIARYTREIERVNIALKDMDFKRVRFLGHIAHDLKTPLTSIKAYAELILKYKDKPPEVYEEFLNVIKEESNRMTALINDYLILMRLESDRIDYRMEALNLSEIVKQFIAMFSSLLLRNNLSINIDVPDDLPMVAGDKERINQVLINLLNNAVKFTPSGGSITITLNIAKFKMPDDSLKKFIEVSVADTGPGIPPDYRDKIFDKFFQIDDHIVKAKGGTGLGLAIVKDIIEYHGGRIWVEESKDGGADFRFTIPVRE
jgi:PAS domain S-box-containing protein